MRKEDNNVLFNLIAKKFLENDLDWFRDKAVEENISYYIQIQAGYSFVDSLAHSIDLGPSPRFHRVDPSELTASQQAYLRGSKRKLEKEPPKLCSLHQEDCTITDFVDCLFYMRMFHSIIVKDVLVIVQYTCANFLAPYMQMLQQKRAESTSNVESKIMKALGNTVAGKFHQRITSYYNIRICTSKQQFLRYLHRSNFYDYKFLSPTSCLILQDEKIVTCTNICSIPGERST